MPDILSARGLKVAYRDARGFEKIALDLSALDFAPGSATAVMGPSGSGKSTLLYALAGLARAQGRVEWRGRDMLALSARAREKWRRGEIGFVFQDFQLVAELSPLENILLPARFDHFAVPAALRARAKYLLEEFGVPAARRSVRELSRGEAQRVALARALLRSPAILLADEPTASLDEASAQTVIDALVELSATEGVLLITATHDTALAARCRRIVRLDHGRFAADAAERAA